MNPLRGGSCLVEFCFDSHEAIDSVADCPPYEGTWKKKVSSARFQEDFGPPVWTVTPDIIADI
jgi:hypothetical protein